MIPFGRRRGGGSGTGDPKTNRSPPAQARPPSGAEAPAGGAATVLTFNPSMLRHGRSPRRVHDRAVRGGVSDYVTPRNRDNQHRNGASSGASAPEGAGGVRRAACGWSVGHQSRIHRRIDARRESSRPDGIKSGPSRFCCSAAVFDARTGHRLVGLIGKARRRDGESGTRSIRCAKLQGTVPARLHFGWRLSGVRPLLSLCRVSAWDCSGGTRRFAVFA